MDLSGILSQAGFAFQMKVFLKQVTELNPNAVASYEYLDDISASTSLDELSGRIGLCESRLIQVKNTNGDCGQKVGPSGPVWSPHDIQ